MCSDTNTTVSIALCSQHWTMLSLMNNRIVFRALQGLGASGVYSLVFIIVLELVPKSGYPRAAAYISAIVAIATFCGPLLGGLINTHTTWRWIFILKSVFSRLHISSLCLTYLASPLVLWQSWYWPSPCQMPFLTMAFPITLLFLLGASISAVFY